MYSRPCASKIWSSCKSTLCSNCTLRNLKSHKIISFLYKNFLVYWHCLKRLVNFIYKHLTPLHPVKLHFLSGLKAISEYFAAKTKNISLRHWKLQHKFATSWIHRTSIHLLVVLPISPHRSMTIIRSTIDSYKLNYNQTPAQLKGGGSIYHSISSLLSIFLSFNSPYT